MLNVIQIITDRLSGKAPKGAKRDKSWRQIRKEHLKKQPCCELCGSRKKLEVHHVLPFHLFPDMELNPENLMTLCENKKYGVCCHQFAGHLGNYRRFNPDAKLDVLIWNQKIKGGESGKTKT